MREFYLMTEKWGLAVVAVMASVLAVTAIYHTFIEQSILWSVFAISSFSTMLWVFRNPAILLSKSWEEFGELFDDSKDKKLIFGSPLFLVLILVSILYIYFF